MNPGGSLCGGTATGKWNYSTLIAAYMPSDTPYYFTGALDEYAVYNRALSGSDIANHASLAGVPEPTSCVLLITGLLGLLAYAWRKRK